MTEEIQAWTYADLAKKIVLLKTLADLVNDELRHTKILAASKYPKGASIPARTDSDEKLGRVTKSDPKPVARVTDQEALDAYIRAEFPDKLEHDVRLGDMGEVLAALIDAGRKDLITETEVIPPYLDAQVLASALTGKPVPGVTVVRPDGVVSARVERAAIELVRNLLAGAPVQLLGIEA